MQESLGIFYRSVPRAETTPQGDLALPTATKQLH